MQTKTKKEPENLTEKDRRYLQHIAQGLKAENAEAFNLDMLPTSWLTTDQLRSSAVYWSKYSQARLYGWLAGLLVAVLAIPIMNYFLAFGAVGIILVYLVVVTGITLGVGHGLTGLLLIPEKNRKFNPTPMKKADHLAVKWTLQEKNLLPKTEKAWLKKMEKLGNIVKTETGFYRLVSQDE